MNVQFGSTFIVSSKGTRHGFREALQETMPLNDVATVYSTTKPDIFVIGTSDSDSKDSSVAFKLRHYLVPQYGNLQVYYHAEPDMPQDKADRKNRAVVGKINSGQLDPFLSFLQNPNILN